MKKLILLFYVMSITLFNSICLQGQDITLLGSLNPYPGSAYANIWGYYANGREYAIMGVEGGTTIIDITNPAAPVEVEFIPGPFAPPYEWREIKTHLNYVYVVSEGGGTGSGMQIIDLSNLPVSATLVNTYNTTFTSAHEIYIADGFAYVVGTNQGGMHILSLANPTNPVQVGYYGSSGYIHDVYVWNDTAYASSVNTYDLVNLSNKSNPQLISQSAAIPGIYAHSGWLTEDKRYFIACEEFNVVDLTVWDLQDRTTWDLVVPSWQLAGTNPIHNIFILGQYAHISYYKDGYIVMDVSNPSDPTLVAQYDTYPGTGGGTYNGAWGVYPYLPSGNSIVSDMSTGLYVCRFEPPVPVELTSFTASTSGSSVTLNWTTSTEVNNLGFEIQRRTGSEFVTIGFTEGFGTSTEIHNYSYIDQDLNNGIHTYRLKQIDFDGTTKYSDLVEVQVFFVTSLELEQNYPNPFNPSTTIKYSVPENGLVNLSVYNLLGEKVAELVNDVLNTGEYNVNFNASQLTSGIYIAKLNAGSLVKSIKMSLVK
ncbi:MAG: choice-of-anchor B family protein [Ignavibacteriales bacterium]